MSQLFAANAISGNVGNRRLDFELIILKFVFVTLYINEDRIIQKFANQTKTKFNDVLQ